MDKTNYYKFLRILGTILFIYILFRIDLSEVAAAFKKIDIVYYLICLLCSIIGFFVRVKKWQILTDTVGAKTTFGGLVKMSFKGFFWGIITPGKLGEFLRAKYLSEKTGITSGTAFFTAFMDRISDILIAVVIGFIGFFVVYFKFGKAFDWKIPVSIISGMMTAGYFLIKWKGLQSVIITAIKFIIPGFLKEKTGLFLMEFFQGFTVLNPRIFFKISVSSFLYYLIAGPIFHYFLALALGISIPLWYLFLIVAIIWLMIALPLSIFGLGAREAGFIYFLSILGIPASLAVAFSLLTMITNILLALPGAILFLRKK